MNGEAPRHPDLGDVIISEQQLRDRVAELGKEITGDYEDRDPLLVAVLKGAFVFMADLAREISLPIEFDFMAVSSYGSSTKTSGVVRIVKDLDLDIADRHVLLVEDIVDTGLTLNYLRKNLLSRQPASLEICTLLVRSDVDRDEAGIRYAGFEIGGDFVVGYGLDAAQRHRGLPHIATFAGEA
jgi:hypoxanthine phosphoribosyltransferase